MEAYSSLHANEYCAYTISIPVQLAVGTHQTSWRGTQVHCPAKQGHLPGPSEIPNKVYTRIQGVYKVTMSLRQRFSYSYMVLTCSSSLQPEAPHKAFFWKWHLFAWWWYQVGWWVARHGAAAEQGGGGRHSGENQRECEKHCVVRRNGGKR